MPQASQASFKAYRTKVSADPFDYQTIIYQGATVALLSKIQKGNNNVQ